MNNMDILETVINPKPLIHLYGYTVLHTNILSIIKDASDSRSRQDISYKSYDYNEILQMPSYGDNYYQESTRADGLMRTSWYTKIANDLPSVMILVFDWSQEKDEIAWHYREEEIRSQISKLRERSRDARLMIMIFGNDNDTSRIEAKISSLKKNTELESKGIYFICNGTAGLVPVSKKFEKTLFDYSISYYKDLKSVTKAKQHKINKDDFLNIRYHFKNGFFTEIIKGQSKAIKSYQESYDLIKEHKEVGLRNFSYTEVREVADLIVNKLLSCYLKHYNIESALALFKKHFDLFSRNVFKIRDKIKFSEVNWRMIWMRKFGEMLQQLQMNKVGKFKDFWYFPGHYFLNTLHLMQQKVKIFQIHNYTLETDAEDSSDSTEGKDDPLHPSYTKIRKLWFDPHEFQSKYAIQMNEFIGKNPIISCHPNPMAHLVDEEYKSALIMYKVYNELTFNYQHEFESVLKLTLDSYSSQQQSDRIIDHIYSMASDFYFKQENYKKCREMKSYVATRMARQNWNDVAADLIEKVKVCSLKMKDYESFVQSEFELINVKKEDINVKKQRINRIISKFEESKEAINQKFALNNPLIKVFARFDCKTAEIFDSVTLSIRILSAINFKFNKLYINFNDKSFNKEIFDSDGNELELKPDSTYQNDLTIFIRSQIKSDLKLDYVMLEKTKKNGDSSLSLLIHPVPEINIDHLFFDTSKENNEQVDKSVQDPKDDLLLKISEIRQKIDLQIEYSENISSVNSGAKKNCTAGRSVGADAPKDGYFSLKESPNIFLGELAMIDFTLKCRKGCEIIDASMVLTDISDEAVMYENQFKVREI